MTTEPDPTQPDRVGLVAPNPDRRGVGYWLADVVGLVPLVAPLVLEAVIHSWFARRFLGFHPALSLLIPASVGLGAVRVALHFDRARLRGDPTGLIRCALYGYMLVGFALSYWYLAFVPPGPGEVRPEASWLPAVVVGLAQAASVGLWEMRTRMRHREVLRARRQLDTNRLSRILMFPRWHWRMRRWMVATGQTDYRAAEAAFGPLMVARLANRHPGRYPTQPAPDRAGWAPPAGPDPVPQPDRAPARVVPIGSTQPGNRDLMMARLREQWPNPTRRNPSRSQVEEFLNQPDPTDPDRPHIGSTVARRLLQDLLATRPDQTDREEPTA